MAKSFISCCKCRIGFTSAAYVASQARCVDIGGRRPEASKVILRARALEGERKRFRWIKVQQASVYNTENHILELMANKCYGEKQVFGWYKGKNLYQ